MAAHTPQIKRAACECARHHAPRRPGAPCCRACNTVCEKGSGVCGGPRENPCEVSASTALLLFAPRRHGMTGASEHEATLMGLCNDFVEVHRRLAQLESLLPWEELPAPPAKRQCVTQVAVPEPIARPPPEPAEGCGSQPPSAVPSAQGGRCSKGHLLKRAVVGSCKGLVCDGPCGRSLRSNMALVGTHSPAVTRQLAAPSI